MNLSFNSSPKHHLRQYFFSLEIGSGILQTSIWTVENNKVQVLSSGTYEEYLHSSDFISAADKSLTQSALSLKIDPASIKRVILGLPASWLSQERILPEKSKFLKEICQKLSLKPIGFVVSAEAVVRYLHTTEGVPPTAIIIGVSGSDLEVTVVRLGKIVGVHTVKRGGNITEDVKEGLSRFLPTDLFPSRIMLYDHGVELESLRQTLLSFSWQAPQHRLPFLHFPKIDVLPPDTSIIAISVTAGGEAISSQPQVIESVVEEINPEVISDLGFVENIDLALTSPQKKANIERPKTIRPKFKLPSLPVLPVLPSLRAIPAVIALLILLLLPIAYWYYFVTAKIVLTFRPQTITASFTAQLPFKTISTDAESEINLPTTGQVLIGDKATGVVTVVNGTTQIKTFSSGTELTSDSGLKFVTSENVTIASASGSADPNSYQPGKSDVKISSVNIGQDSNLSAGSEFKIGSFSKLDYVARNSQAFSGGTSRQASAVSKKDLADAKSQAEADLLTKSEAALKNTLPEGAVLISGTLTQKVISETTNFKEGEAADQLIYTKKVKSEGKTYQQADLDKLVEEKLSPQYPPNSKLLSSPKIEISFKGNTTSIIATVELAPDINTDEIAQKLLGQSVSKADGYFKNLSGLSETDIEFKPQKGELFKRFPYRSQNLSIFSTFVTP